MAGFAAAGFLITVVLMREIPMTNETDDTWGLERTDGEADTHKSPDKTAIQSAAAVPSEAIAGDKTAEGQAMHGQGSDDRVITKTEGVEPV